jgi:hypothetical protein
MAALGAVERLERAAGHRTPLDDTRRSSVMVKRPRATAATLPPRKVEPLGVTRW